ncbi:MAG TPA: hypothetical protein VFW97_09935 [Acidimicrobiia bacterium]|nr:hypothetical protein [Acidimicrobiia bacterium]
MDAWIWIVIAVVVVLVIIAVVAAAMSKSRRRHHLQERFGSEYDRTVEGADRRRDAERDLRDREQRHDELELRPLSDASRQRYTQQWQDMQTGFVDRPQVAVADADRLVTDLMRERGYPVDDFETRSDLVSVDHPDVVENYRTAHGIAVRTVDGRTSTEDLRQAVISYRALFEEMLVDEPEPSK